MSPYLRTPVLRACAKITWRNARSGSDQCSIPNAQFLSEPREAARVRAVLIEAGDLILHGANDAQSDIHFLMAAPENCALGIEHWSDPGSDAEQWILPSYFCASPKSRPAHCQSAGSFLPRLRRQ